MGFIFDYERGSSGKIKINELFVRDMENDRSILGALIPGGKLKTILKKISSQSIY